MVSLDGVVPSRMVRVSASVNLPLHHKVQKFSSGTGSPGWSRKRAVKRLWCGFSHRCTAGVAELLLSSCDCELSPTSLTFKHDTVSW